MFIYIKEKNLKDLWQHNFKNFILNRISYLKIKSRKDGVKRTFVINLLSFLI